MNRSKIEWCDYTWNPLTGCSRRCDYCYARAMAKRLRGRYGYPYKDPFQVTFHPDRLHEPREVKKPSKIFTCSMGEIFDPRSNFSWVGEIFAEIKRNPQHTFQILTKQYGVLDQFYYPENVWIGVSIDGRGLDTEIAVRKLREIDFEITRFISFEPLLGKVTPDLSEIDWIIIGSKTGYKPVQPKEEWVRTLTKLAKDHGCAVFHKDNLEGGWLKEYPE